MMKFRVELWRIVKFLLITAAVNLVFALLDNVIIYKVLTSPSGTTGTWLSAISWGFTLGTTLVATLIHRYFTFRATEPWYIAVPIMLVAVIGWQLLEALPMGYSARLGMQSTVTMTYLLSFAWMILSYLLQRCVIYCHTTDQNGWYRRFHPTNDE